MQELQPFREQDAIAAQTWYAEHKAHVDEMLANCWRLAYPPSGSDRIHPELWKSAHWKWFFSREETPRGE